MRKLTLAGSTAVGVVLGGIIFNATSSYADMPTIDATVQAAVQAVGSAVQAVQKAVGQVQSAVNTVGTFLGDNTFGSVQQLLQQGFTQTSNYLKAQVGAQEQITDASNTAMARFQRDMRNAQIRDEQTASPAHCTALDGGVSTQAAAVQAFSVGATIARIHDLRAEAGPGMPSFFGQGQGIASMGAEHIANYCNPMDAAANLCATSATPDADQQMQSLFGSGVYADQTAVNTAKDYAVTLIEPVAPTPLRGDQLSSVAGQDAAVRRRSFNARMSLAQAFVDTTIGMQSPSVPLTAQQQQYLQNIGLPAQTNGSWLQALQIESERRISDVSWHTSLQAMTGPAAIEREIANELALNNYLLFQTFKLGLMHTTISAAHLAEDTERHFQPAVQMPVPSFQ
jgi:hypothetical protein